MKTGMNHVRLRTTLLVTMLALAAVLLSATASQAATPGWKLLAVAGPTHLPPRQSEVQQVSVEAEGGTFTLAPVTAKGQGTANAAQGAFTITEGSNEAELILGAVTPEPGMAVITTPATLPDGTVITAVAGKVVTFSNPAARSGIAFLTLSSPVIKEVSSSFGAFNVGDGVSGEGVPAGTTIVGVEGESLTLSQAPRQGGTIALTGSESTDPIPYGADAATVQGEFEALPAFTTGLLATSGGPSGGVMHPYLVSFGGPLADQDAPELGSDSSGLLGEHAIVKVLTTVPGGAGTGEIAIAAANIGGTPTLGEYTLRLGPLPAGIVTAGPAKGGGGSNWSCVGGAGEASVTCTSADQVPPLSPGFNVNVPIEITSSAQSASVPVTIEGGGSAPASYQVPLEVSTAPTHPGVAAFWAGSFDENGKESTQAGGHPYSAATYFMLNTIRSVSGVIMPVGDSRDVIVDLPPGFLGDPMATRRCPQSTVTAPGFEGREACNVPEMSVGKIQPSLSEFGFANPTGFLASIWNDVPASGYAAEFTTKIGFPQQSLIGSLRSSEDYGVTIEAPNNPNYNRIYGGFVALEGFPAAANGKAFLRNPTDCAETAREAPRVNARYDTWQEAGKFWPTTHVLPPISGCQALNEAWLGHGPRPEQEAPTFSFKLTDTQGSSPTGAVATVHVPQGGLTAPGELATSDLKKAVVSLPAGLSVNPSSANGLQACSEDQVGYLGSNFSLPNPMRFNEDPVNCPDASKLGTFDVKTPLLEEEVHGTIYLAAQEANPFHSLIAVYLVVENERFGLHLKLPGEVRTDPSTGQLSAVFDYNPQVPFEDLTLHFRGGGPRATLATPEVCGHYESTGSLEPWSAEAGEALPIHEGGFDTSNGCAPSDGARPFAPSFEAGTTGTQAGAYNPLTIKVVRKDGEQELRSLDFTLPKGLLGRLAGIPYCPESSIKAAESKSGKDEQASASCPVASQIGTVDTSAGVGSEPIHVGGKVYLAGPYKGAPLSSVVVTPAVAGPFDLGNVVIRAPLYVNPETTEITAKSDTIPTILRGIPLKVRSIAITLDRSNFTLNPTSCEPMLVTASLRGSSGGSASPSNRFQVGSCKALKFKPKLQVSLKGSTKRAGLPSLKAVVTYPKHGAYSNIARAQVNLPHSEFIEQNNLDKTCTKPVLLEGKCTKRSIYGKAKAWTPLLDKPLEGPVYLVGGYGYKLPALVADLNGQIRVLLKGKVDSGPNKGIRNTFEAVPDAPVSRFVLEMKGGKNYGLLVNSENLCGKPQRAIARFTAQNGLVNQTKPLVRNQCGKAKGGKRKPKKG